MTRDTKRPMRATVRTVTERGPPPTPDDLSRRFARASAKPRVRDDRPVHIHRLAARLGTEQCDELCRRYQDGESANSVAKAFGVSKPAVLDLLRSRFITVRAHRLTPALIEQTIRDYEAGQSIAQIANGLVFNPSGIWRALKMRSVTMRPQGFQPKGARCSIVRPFADK